MGTKPQGHHYSKPWVKGVSDTSLVLQAQGGDMGALDVLLRKYRSFFMCHAGRAGGAEADDVYQEACIRVVLHLGSLRSPESFQSWFLQLLYHEAGRRRRFFQRVGTESLKNDSDHVEAIMIQASFPFERDADFVWEVLDARARALAEPLTRIGRFMLEHFRQEEEFPTVRLIASASRCSKGVAERGRRTVLLDFREQLHHHGFEST